MSEREMADVYLDTLEELQPSEAVMKVIRDMRTTKLISRDPRLHRALEEAEAGSLNTATENLSETCAVIAEQHGASPELMNKAIGAGRIFLQEQ